MGRKSKATKLASTSRKANNPSPSLEVETDESVPKTPNTCSSMGKQKSKDKGMIVRRSSRLQSIFRPAQNQEIEEVNLVEDEQEVEECFLEKHVESPEKEIEPHVEECIHEPHVERHNDEPNPKEKGLEERVNDLVQTVEELISKGLKKRTSSESTSTDLNYKGLYIDSQKKVEGLIEVNHRLSTKLEVALAKLDAFKEVKEVMEKIKEVIFVTNLGRAAEAVLNLSSQAVLNQVSSPGAIQPDAIVAPQTSPRKKNRRSKKD